MTNGVLDNISVSTEEVFGPPKVDGIGFLIISLVGLVSGFLVGIIVFLFAFLTLKDFSLSSGAAPIILAMITFFATVIGNFLYIWGLALVFPHIYSGTKTLFVQISIFSILLYALMAGVYMAVNALPLGPQAILGVYVVHIIFDVFGLILITGILSMYRYSLLVFYASFASLLLTGMIGLFAFVMMSTSSTSLFVFMVFSALAFFVTTATAFGILSFYYRIYTTSGYDPLGDIFDRIASEETEQLRIAQDNLFRK